MKARLPQGMGKGPSNNMNQMLKQAQKMQKQMEEAQAELELIQRTLKHFRTSLWQLSIRLLLTSMK